MVFTKFFQYYTFMYCRLFSCFGVTLQFVILDKTPYVWRIWIFAKILKVLTLIFLCFKDITIFIKFWQLLYLVNIPISSKYLNLDSKISYSLQQMLQYWYRTYQTIIFSNAFICFQFCCWILHEKKIVLMYLELIVFEWMRKMCIFMKLNCM